MSAGRHVSGSIVAWCPLSASPWPLHVSLEWWLRECPEEDLCLTSCPRFDNRCLESSLAAAMAASSEAEVRFEGSEVNPVIWLRDISSSVCACQYAASVRRCWWSKDVAADTATADSGDDRR